jgi:predicted ATPase
MVLTTTNTPSRLRFHTAFLGRRQELEEILALFRTPSVRLVTLIGPGGVGKTRLAARVAELLSSELDSRLVHVPLSSVGDDEDVLEVIGRTIGVAVSDEALLSSVIGHSLNQESTLLLLDNFEHLLDQSTAVGLLLAAAPNARVLVTSRAPLEIRGEHVYTVQPFRLPNNAE